MGESRNLSNILPAKLYRGLLMLTASWPGVRVSENSLLIKVHVVENSQKLPLIWCGGPPELETIISIIGKDRSIYGLRGTYDFVEPTDDVICKLSQYYVDEIEKAISADTYIIAGYCAAAYLALEISTLLTERGHKVGYLAMIERDVTETNRLLWFTRKIFNRLDTYGTRYTEALQSIDENKHSLFTHLKYMPKIICKMAKPEVQTIDDPRNLISYKRRETRDKMYEFKPYPSNASLFFIRWGVFGFYQFKYFQNYWRKIALGGVTVDFIEGYSHKYPNWPSIIQKVNKRLLESRY
ncbi:MAG TPA: thioesterase domain-containing protein [Methylophilaceae bacterium]|jgi:thioesterase domain-containing protein